MHSLNVIIVEKLVPALSPRIEVQSVPPQLLLMLQFYLIQCTSQPEVMVLPKAPPVERSILGINN
jgi:hypothetical protein